MLGKKKKETDFVKCCMNCEYAQYSSEEDFPSAVLCTRTKKTKDSEDCCRRHVYDLLKRKPFRPVELPSLDPDALHL